MKRIITVMLAAAMLLSAAASLSGCSLREPSPADTYSSPLRSKDTESETKDEAEVSSGFTEKDYGSDKNSTDSDKSIVSDIISTITSITESNTDKKSESKSESKTESKKKESKVESKAESKKAESKIESKQESKEENKSESKTETKAESKTESKAESKTESKAASKTESKAESKANNKTESKDETSALYKDIMSLIKDDDEVVGYAICKLVGSEDEHLIIEYGGIDYEEEKETDTSNIIIVDPEAYAREQEEKAAAREDEIEQSRLYSIYRIDSDRVIPEGDLSGYYTTAYISSNTGTLGMYYTKDTIWRFGLVELDGNSAFVNFSNEGTLEETGSFPALPGDVVNFSEPGKFDIINKYK